MHSVCSNMPFSVRWLICNRNANIDVKNSENKKNALFFSHNCQESEYDQRHFINWWLIARELIDHGANAME